MKGPSHFHTAESTARTTRQPPRARYVLDTIAAAPTRATAARFTRKELIEALVLNDANGVYTDADARREGFSPMTKAEAADLLVGQLV